MSEVKETKAQRVERIKREKDGLDVLADIHRYAATGEPVDPEDIDRFKWYGLYTQNATLKSEDDPETYFMLRIKLESGLLTPAQVRCLGEISREYARNTADLTTRQDVQFHWIRVADLPAIFEKLARVGLSSSLAAGDVPRNVVSCPVNGIDHGDVADVRHLVEAVNGFFRNNRDFSNLPRKFKIGISGCSKDCISHEVQDLAFVAVPDESGAIVYEVHVGGGLAKNRRIADYIGRTPEAGVLAIAQAVGRIFRDHGNRENRDKARLGHLVEAWGVEKFAAELERESGVSLLPAKPRDITPYGHRGHFGLQPSKRGGYSFIGCAILSGHIGGEGLLSLADLIETHGAGSVKATTTQNLVVLDVPVASAAALAEALNRAGLGASPSVFRARTLACTGLNFCKFAVSETKGLAEKIVAHLERYFPEFTEPVSISVTGCPNSCSHPHIVDIGLLGAMVKRNEENIRGFELIYGGYLEGEKSHFGRKTGIKITPEEAPLVIESLLREYSISGAASFREYILEKTRENETLPALA